MGKKPPAITIYGNAFFWGEIWRERKFTTKALRTLRKTQRLTFYF